LLLDEVFSLAYTFQPMSLFKDITTMVYRVKETNKQNRRQRTTWTSIDREMLLTR